MATAFHELTVRDVEPEAGALDQVFLYNIDDLQTIVKENLSRRTTEVERAEVERRVGAGFQQHLDGVGASFDQPLVGHRRTGIHIGADELAACERRNGDRRLHVSGVDRVVPGGENSGGGLG